MSDEITIKASLSIVNGNYSDSASASISANQATLGGSGGIQVIGTSEENLDLSEIAGTCGYLYLRNLDATNYVEWGQDNAGTMQTVGLLAAGDVAIFRVAPSTNVRMKAHTASVKVQFLGFQY